MIFVEILIKCLEAFLLFMLLRVSVGYEPQFKYAAVFGWIVIAAFTFFWEYFCLNRIAYYVISTVLHIFYAAFCFDRKNSLRFIYAFSLVVYSTIANNLVLFILPLVQPGSVQYYLNGPSMMNENPAFRLEVLVLYAFVLLLLFVPTMFIKPREMFFTRRHLLAMFFLIVLCICGTTVVFSFTVKYGKYLDSTLPLGIVSVILLVIIVSIIVLFYRLAAIARQYYEEQLELNTLRNEKTRFEQIQATFDYLRKAKHDFNIHMRAIHRMAGQKNDLEISRYVSELINDAPDGTFGVYTGNAAVDAVITEAALTAEKNNIDFSAAVIVPGTVPLSDAEMCSCLGNLLDNALEAAVKSDGKRFINLLIDSNKETMRIRVRNSSNGVYKTDKTGFLTIKADSLQHGFGIGRIKEIVAKHNGMCSFIPKNDYFEAIIYLPI